MRFVSLIAPIVIVAAAPAAAQQTPEAALKELQATEQSLSGAAARMSPAGGIASMLADDVVLMTRAGPVKGRTQAAASLAANPANKGNHASWRPIRGGVSADGQHGFTQGYLDVDGGDPATAHRRYLAYWVRGSDGWRVAAFKQVIRAAGEADQPAQPAALPTRKVAPDAAKTAAHKASLIAAEKAFSDRSQVVGLAQAFQENGRPDAIHLFGPKGFAIGLEAIGENFSSQPGGPATIHWGADDAIVASSGDLGVTIGVIRPNGEPTEGQPAESPFFTIWMRDDPSQPWRYIAE
jgi:ketosteroid isomerase-like protein